MKLSSSIFFLTYLSTAQASLRGSLSSSHRALDDDVECPCWTAEDLECISTKEEAHHFSCGGSSVIDLGILNYGQFTPTVGGNPPDMCVFLMRTYVVGGTVCIRMKGSDSLVVNLSNDDKHGVATEKVGMSDACKTALEDRCVELGFADSAAGIMGGADGDVGLNILPPTPDIDLQDLVPDVPDPFDLFGSGGGGGVNPIIPDVPDMPDVEMPGIGDLLSGVVEDVEDGVTNVADTITGAAEDVQETVTGIAGGSVEETVSNVADSISGATEDVQDTVSNVADSISGAAEDAQETVTGIAGGAGDSAGGVFDNASNAVGDAVDGAQEAIEDVTEEAQNTITDVTGVGSSSGD